MGLVTSANSGFTFLLFPPFVTLVTEICRYIVSPRMRPAYPTQRNSALVTPPLYSNVEKQVTYTSVRQIILVVREELQKTVSVRSLASWGNLTLRDIAGLDQIKMGLYVRVLPRRWQSNVPSAVRTEVGKGTNEGTAAVVIPALGLM